MACNSKSVGKLKLKKETQSQKKTLQETCTDDNTRKTKNTRAVFLKTVMQNKGQLISEGNFGVFKSIF